MSDWGGKVTHQYGIYKDEYQAPRRVNFLIGKDGKIMEEQVDKDAIDPTKIVDACAASEDEKLGAITPARRDVAC